MNDRIVFTNPDGSVGVITPTGAVPAVLIAERIAEENKIKAELTAAMIEARTAFEQIDTEADDVKVRTEEIKKTIQAAHVKAQTKIIRLIEHVQTEEYRQRIILVVMAEDVPAGAINARIIDTADLPTDRLFRGAWTDLGAGKNIGIVLVKAKEIAHNMRRVKRAEDFAPHDEIILRQVPGTDTPAAEAARQAIREADAIAQTGIDGAKNESSLRDKLKAMGVL